MSTYFGFQDDHAKKVSFTATSFNVYFKILSLLKKSFPRKREEKDWDCMKSLSLFINIFGTLSISIILRVARDAIKAILRVINPQIY